VDDMLTMAPPPPANMAGSSNFMQSDAPLERTVVGVGLLSVHHDLLDGSDKAFG